MAQLVRNLPELWELYLWVGKIPWRRERATHSSILARRIRGLSRPWGQKESDTTEWLLLHFTVGSFKMRFYKSKKLFFYHYLLDFYYDCMLNFVITFYISTDICDFFILNYLIWWITMTILKYLTRLALQDFNAPLHLQGQDLLLFLYTAGFY